VFLKEVSYLPRRVAEFVAMWVRVDASRNKFLSKAEAPFYNPLSSLSSLLFTLGTLVSQQITARLV
jgi:hypothetical protein